MSQTGTPTEFLQLGITEPDDTLNVLVDLNGQWQKIDTGVKNVDTKANTNASGISALNTAVQDNTENITNILETNVNQQTSIDTLQSKVATLEEDDTSYGSRITAVEAGVQENSELINDLEVDLSGVKTNVGTVPSGSNLQGEVDGLDTRVTALENSGSVAAVEARVTTLENNVGTVPAGETVQGQISDLDTDVTALQGQVNSGNIPFRFSVDGGGNYGYLKADDSFVPFSSGDSHWHELDTNLYYPSNCHSFICAYKDYSNSESTNYGKVHDLINDVDYTIPNYAGNDVYTVGNIILQHNGDCFVISNDSINLIDTVVGVTYENDYKRTHYLTKNGTNYSYNVVDSGGNSVGSTVNFTVPNKTANTPTTFASNYDHATFDYIYNSVINEVSLNPSTGTSSSRTTTVSYTRLYYMLNFDNSILTISYNILDGSFYMSFDNKTIVNIVPKGEFLCKINNKYYYYV